MAYSLFSIHSYSPQLGIQSKQNVQNFRLLLQIYAQFEFFRKGSGNSFCMIFQEKFFSCYNLLTDEIHCVIAYTSWVTGQYNVYCNCIMFPILRRQTFWNCFFYIPGFSFTNIHESKDCRRRRRTFLYFHPLHGRLDISRAVTAESSPLHIASSRTRAGNLWFPSASH